MKTLITFMCFLRELGCVYDLSHTLQMYGLSDVCTCMCFFLSLLLAKRLSQPSNSHLNGFSPAGLNNTHTRNVTTPARTDTRTLSFTVTPPVKLGEPGDVNCAAALLYNRGNLLSFYFFIFFYSHRGDMDTVLLLHAALLCQALFIQEAFAPPCCCCCCCAAATTGLLCCSKH